MRVEVHVVTGLLSRHPREFSGQYNYTLGTGTHILQSHLLWGEFSAFSTSVIQFFSFHQVPITARWKEAAWNEKFA